MLKMIIKDFLNDQTWHVSFVVFVQRAFLPRHATQTKVMPC